MSKPMHMAVNTSNVKVWAEEHETENASGKYIAKVDDLLNFQLQNQIPILSVKLLHKARGLTSGLAEYFDKLADDPRIHENKIRIFVIGRWYDLRPELVSSIKKVMENTKDYDENFLNFCIAYDGQDEIVSSVRVLARLIESGKVKAEDVNEDMIKENLSSSYFPPPDLVVETSKTYSGMLLWDMKNALIHFTNKMWLDMDQEDLENALEFYRGSKS